MHLIDSHCHLQSLDQTTSTVAQYVEFAQQAGVKTLLSVAIDLNDLESLKQYAEQFSNVYYSVGVHPNEIHGKIPSVDELCELAAPKKAIALGETGLDYYRAEEAIRADQMMSLRHHIRAARTLQKPLIIHMRDASEDTLAILAEEKAHEVGGVMHCFTATLDIAQKALALGFLISFSGIVTFKNAVELQAVASALADNDILIETDSPYLAPTPYRGKPNQPAFVVETAKMLANLRHCSLEYIAAITTANFRRLFKFV